MYGILLQTISTCLELFWDDSKKKIPSETWTHPPTSIVNSDFLNVFLCKAPWGKTMFYLLYPQTCTITYQHARTVEPYLADTEILQVDVEQGTPYAVDTCGDSVGETHKPEVTAASAINRTKIV